MWRPFTVTAHLLFIKKQLNNYIENTRVYIYTFFFMLGAILQGRSDVREK
jgi:hypothetical protein